MNFKKIARLSFQLHITVTIAVDELLFYFVVVVVNSLEI